MRTLSVALGERSYPIHIGEGVLARCGEWLPALPSRRAVVVTNPIVAALHLDVLQVALFAADISNEVIVVPEGETHKDWATLYEAVRDFRGGLEGLKEYEVSFTVPEPEQYMVRSAHRGAHAGA